MSPTVIFLSDWGMIMVSSTYYSTSFCGLFLFYSFDMIVSRKNINKPTIFGLLLILIFIDICEKKVSQK